MPRKLAAHSLRVVSALTPLLPSDWKILSIDNLSEDGVAEILSQSSIFMAFSEFEGLPVPPVEASLCGNYVIGYHGEGGREYWQAPNFTEVNQGDIQGFVKAVLNKVQLLEKIQITPTSCYWASIGCVIIFHLRKKSNFLEISCNPFN